jgi:hypothetical protein
LSTSFFIDRVWDSFSPADLGPAAKIPTMLQFDEQAYYVALTRDWARGAGAIVDLGSFAGGSAACLAEGARQAGRDQVVHGYDKFEVGDFEVFRKRYRTYCKNPPSSESPHEAPPLLGPFGTDLLPIAERFLAPWEQGVKLYKGQIEEIGWHGGDIEILVMDASKTAETMDKMSALFFPHLIPGHSIVVQQDFLWWQQPWVAVQMAILSEYFEPVVHVPRDSVSFRYKKEIPEDVLETLRVAELDDGVFIEYLRAMKQAVKPLRIDRAMRQLIASVKANPGQRAAFRYRTKP